MQTYPVDIDPEQVVRWIKDEWEASPHAFQISARQVRERRSLPLRKENHLGDEEREDLSEVATLATLDIAPRHGGDGWLLSVVVEDELGPRVSDSGSDEDERTIDLGTFYATFIRPERGNAYVIAEVDNAAAKARLTRLIQAIETNRHGVIRGRSNKGK
jgi:hypothetical protein